MTSTLLQYFFVSLCVLVLAGSLVHAGEHGATGSQKDRGIASVVKDHPGEQEGISVPNEDGEKLIDTHKKLQERLDQFKTGNISEEQQ